MKVIVLGGGNSPEREVSLRSSSAVAEALKTAGHKVIQIDPQDGLSELEAVAPVTIVFPILHGAGGEDGVIQAELEKRNLPYLGTKSKESRICFDKGLTREALEKAGLPIAKGDTVNSETYWEHPLTKQPHVIKDSLGGSSIGTYIVRDPLAVDESRVKEVFALGDEAVIEELIVGTEITVSILENSALPVIEIQPPDQAEFDYENKYNGQTQEICPPKSVSQKIQSEAKTLAEKVHQVLGARHLSRVDIMVKPDGSLIILELNTLPGMSMQSLYPKAAAVAGLPMPALVDRFVDLVSRDYGIKHG